MKSLALLFLFLTSYAWSQDCSNPTSKTAIKKTIELIKGHYFPELKDIELKMEILKSDEYFLQTCIKPMTAFRSPLKRTYGIQVNEKIFECSPTPAAIKAILIHEIKHIQDYIHMNSLRLGSFGIKYALNKKFRTIYERQTDEAALFLGQAEGLKEYREWIYQWLNDRQLATKKRYYFTPEEIDNWVLTHPQSL